MCTKYSLRYSCFIWSLLFGFILIFSLFLSRFLMSYHFLFCHLSSLTSYNHLSSHLLWSHFTLSIPITSSFLLPTRSSLLLSSPLISSVHFSFLSFYLISSLVFSTLLIISRPLSSLRFSFSLISHFLISSNLFFLFISVFHCLLISSSFLWYVSLLTPSPLSHPSIYSPSHSLVHSSQQTHLF